MGDGIPGLPDGFGFLIDSSDNYLVDGSGNYLIGPV